MWLVLLVALSGLESCADELQDVENSKLILEAGEEVVADVVIGADGVHVRYLICDLQVRR